MAIAVAEPKLKLTRPGAGRRFGIRQKLYLAFGATAALTIVSTLVAQVFFSQINSAVRQQVNGYVVDLNSAVGVLPVDAETEIAAVEAQITAAISSNI